MVQFGTISQPINYQLLTGDRRAPDFPPPDPKVFSSLDFGARLFGCSVPKAGSNNRPFFVWDFCPEIEPINLFTKSRERSQVEREGEGERERHCKQTLRVEGRQRRKCSCKFCKKLKQKHWQLLRAQFEFVCVCLVIFWFDEALDLSFCERAKANKPVFSHSLSHSGPKNIFLRPRVPDFLGLRL